MHERRNDVQAFPTSRGEVLSSKHHAEVAALPGPEADQLRAAAESNDQKAPGCWRRICGPRSSGPAARRGRRSWASARKRPDKKYGVILADPEWRFEPWSRETGMDRPADNHYREKLTARLCDEVHRNLADR